MEADQIAALMVEAGLFSKTGALRLVWAKLKEPEHAFLRSLILNILGKVELDGVPLKASRVIEDLTVDDRVFAPLIKNAALALLPGREL